MLLYLSVLIEKEKLVSLKLKIKKELRYKIIFLLFIFLIPWIFLSFNNGIEPEKITSDLRFYEINTCSISLFEFLSENPNVIYQDHYKIRFNDYSAMKCFGTITGIDQIKDVFYISIGTSAYLNLFLQSIFWCLMLSFINKSREIIISLKLILSLNISSLLTVLIIYSEERFHVQNIYFHDFNEYIYILQLFLTVLLISVSCYYFLYTRIDNLGNYFPFLFLIIGVYSGFNINFFTIGVTVFGIYRFLDEKKLVLKHYYLLFLLFIWSNNAYNKGYFIDPDKIRGFTSSIFTTQNIFLYSLFFLFLVNGLIAIIKTQKNFDIEKFFKNSVRSALCVLLVGYLGSSFPIVNFFSYYYFGLNKYGIDRSNLFELNQWGERLAWRGNFSSAETIGEFFALVIFIYIYLILFKKITFTYQLFLLITIVGIGLLLSNNRAALISLIFICSVLILKKNRNNNFFKLSIILFLIVTTIVLVGINNFDYSLSFISDSVLNNSMFYSFDSNNYSTAVEYLIEQKDSKTLIYSLFSIFSVFGFYINRSQLWGLFFSRYSPEIQEVLFGSGLNNFGQLYGEMNINSTKSFLLPHSSLLSLLLFIGLINVSILLYFFFTKIVSQIRYTDNIFIYLSIFVFLNLLKSDSILYLGSFINYFFFFYTASELKKSNG